MFNKQFFKGIAIQLSFLSEEEKEQRAKTLRKHLAAEMKRRKLTPLKKP